MHNVTRYALAWPLMLAMVAAFGCNSDADQEVKTEPQNEQSGDPGEGTSASTPVERSPDSRLQGRPGQPRVLIQTSLGNITVELDREKASNTVENFLYYVRDGYYDNTIFHEVIKGYVVIGGSFTVDSQEKSPQRPKQPVYNEARAGMSNVRGTIAMSRFPDDKNSATCQFFFNLADNSSMLDHKESPTGETSDQDFGYCAFGTVVEGMDVVDAIGNQAVTPRGNFESIPVKNVIIQSMKEL